jgi:plasmid stability protein
VAQRRKFPLIRAAGSVSVRIRGRRSSGPDRINVRLPEPLRVTLEIEARSHKHSLNAEIVQRLRESVLARDEPPRIIAKALLSGLDGAIVQEMLDIVMRDHARDELVYMAQDALDEQRIEEDMEREGGEDKT